MRIEHCILFKQKGNLLCGLYHEKPVLLPVNPKSPFYILIENKKMLCVNEIGKETRSIMSELRQIFNLKRI